MSWKVRHQGSPKFAQNLTVQQVAQGLADGYWEPTDEVMGPNDKQWISFENHPQFAEVAMELEMHEPKEYDDETKLDMNALIDVTLVLLIFFILTMTYTHLQKILDAPEVSPEGNVGAPTINVNDKDVKESLIHVRVEYKNNQPEILVEPTLAAGPVPFKADDNNANREALLAELGKYDAGGKRQRLLIEHDDQVPHGVLVQIQDAAKSVGMPKVILAPKAEKPANP